MVRTVGVKQLVVNQHESKKCLGSHWESNPRHVRAVTVAAQPQKRRIMQQQCMPLSATFKGVRRKDNSEVIVCLRVAERRPTWCEQGIDWLGQVMPLNDQL